MPKLLILDLDETLIYAAEEPLEHAADFRVGRYAVYKRPGLDTFLEFAADAFRVAVWTSSTEPYAQEIRHNILPAGYPLEFAWARAKCTRRLNELTLGYDYLKDLRKLGKRVASLDEVIVVDDTPSKLARNYGNLVRVRPFLGEPSDRELSILADYLGELAEVESIRRIEKRGWQSRFE